MYVKEANGQIIVDTYAMHLYLPANYFDGAYRGTPMYSMLGSKVKFLGVGNMRFFKDEKELENPTKVKCHPFGIPMLILSEPSEIEMAEVMFVPNGHLRKCIVLTYYRGDALIVTQDAIKDSAPTMMMLARLEQGKLDHVPPEDAIRMFYDCEAMNGISMRIPTEEMEIFVAERYRDPTHPTRAYRYYTGNLEYDNIISYNTRADVQQSTTFQALMHEDVAVSMITAINREERGERDEAGPFEAVVRGLSLEDYKRADIPAEDL